MKVNEKYYERNMYYGASLEARERAKDLRKNLTKAEEVLWDFLRNRKVLGLKFRRQHPISIYISDFYCHELKLVIEVDGEVQETPDQKMWDRNRKAEMYSFGIEELRFKNEDILQNIEEVISKIAIKCKEIQRTPLYWERGRG